MAPRVGPPVGSARRRAQRAAALLRLRAAAAATPVQGVVAADPGSADLALAAAGHQAAMLRLATRVLDAYRVAD
eukprot:8035520-Alexandrium_andersonii.AAC.1